MAHFFKPANEPPEGYLLDRKLAPDSVGSIEVAVGASKQVGLWGGKQLQVTSKHPQIVPNPIHVRPLNGDTDVLSITGKEVGTALVQTSQGNNIWASLEVKVIDSKAAILLPQDIASRPFPPDFLQQASANFSVGFAEGISAKIDGDFGKTLTDKILANKLDFYGGYVTGLISGLLGGLTSLLKLLCDVAQVAHAMSIPQVMTTLAKEAYLTLTSQAHRTLRAMQIEKAQQTANLVASVIREISSKPMLYVSKSRSSGVLLGGELAAYINKDAKEKSASQLGVFVGEIVGRVLFEILIFIILAAISGGTGEAARGGLAIGEVAEGSKTYAGLLKKLMEVLEEMPAIRKLVAELFEAKGLTSAAKAAEAVDGTEVFRIARQAVLKAPSNAAEKALALEKIFSETTATGASWSAKRGSAVGCEAIFTGEGAPWGIIVDGNGVLWESKNIANSGRFGVEGGKFQYIPDFTKWVQSIPK